MSKFSVYQAIYEVSQHEKTVKKEIKTDAKPYEEVLEIVRAEISKNHSGELCKCHIKAAGRSAS